jgi:hypothetical protein
MSDLETRGTLTWTLGTAAAFGAVFLGVAAARAAGAGTSPLDVWQPLAALGVIGATVGGLIGPLLRGAFGRLRGR